MTTYPLTALTQTGKRAEELDTELRGVMMRLRYQARTAHESGVPKVDIARAAGISRPTLDKWLSV